MNKTACVMSAAVILCAAPWAHAQTLDELTREQKEELVSVLKIAKSAYDEGRFEDALVGYRRAHILLALPKFHYNIALCLERLGRKAEALQAYRSFLDEDPDNAQRGKIERQIGLLEEQVERASIGTLVLDVTPADATVKVDGTTLPGPPYVIERSRGSVEVEVRAEGYLPKTEQAEIEGGTTLKLSMELSPEPTPNLSPRRETLSLRLASILRSMMTPTALAASSRGASQEPAPQALAWPGHSLQAHQ